MRISDWSSDVCSSDLFRLPGARPARLLDADLRGDRQAPLHHRRLQRMAAAVAAGDHLHPGLDPATGPQLGPPAQAGLRRRRARGAALLVAGEVRHPRTGAVRGDPGHPARLARVEMTVKAKIPWVGPTPPSTAPSAGRCYAPDAPQHPVTRYRTAATPTAAPQSPARQATTTAAATVTLACPAPHPRHRPPPPPARRRRAHARPGSGRASAIGRAHV